MARNYDSGSVNPTIYIDIDKIIRKNKQFGKNSRMLNKVVLIAIDDGLNELALRAEAYVKERMASYGLGGGALYSNLEVRRIRQGIYISTHGTSNQGRDYTMFVEFGTGIEGKKNSHPRANARGWKYTEKHKAKNGELLEGWVYPSYETDVNANKWQDEEGNWFAFTRGQASRPFMYETWLYISFTWHSTIQGYIRRAIQKWGDNL